MEQGIKILLVEDSAILQKITSHELTELGCIVDIAANAATAIAQAQGTQYHLVFMDLGLPDSDGMTVTETIRSQKGLNQHTPILALTAHNDPDLRLHCLKIGMNEFLVKPINRELIIKSLQTFVGAKMAC